MKLSKLPPASFIHPAGENLEAVERLTGKVVSMLLAHAGSALHRSPLPEWNDSSGFGPIPENGVAEEEWIRTLRRLLEASMNAANPGFIAHMNSLPITPSILADLAASVSDNNMLSVEMSPCFSRLEQHVLRQLAEMFGLGSDAGGVMVGGGSLANLQALTVARNAVLGTKDDGLASAGRAVLFASEVAHTSLQKAAMILGIGTSGVIPVHAGPDSRMDVRDLQRRIESAKAEGLRPFAIVGTAGTTITGNIDPLPDIADVARRHNLWFHADAAYGGALVFSRRQMRRLSGIERADSITFNPQKWLHVARTSAMALFKDRKVLEQNFRIGAPYMGSDPNVPNIGEISVHGTNRADVLKLWMSLLYAGRGGYEQLIEEGYRLTDYFVRQIRSRPYLETASEPEMNLVCFRAKPDTAPDSWHSRIQDRLLKQHGIFVSLVPYRKARWLRVDILNPFTDESLIDRIFACLDEEIRHSGS